jgi:hypothetical protein
MTHKTQITAGLFSAMLDNIRNQSACQAVGVYTEHSAACEKPEQEVVVLCGKRKKSGGRGGTIFGTRAPPR